MSEIKTITMPNDATISYEDNQDFKCLKCKDTGKYEDRRTLIKMKCDCVKEPKVKMKEIEWGESNE